MACISFFTRVVAPFCDDRLALVALRSAAIASAFSPNANNPIDRSVKVYANNLLPQNFSFTIFNRWGQIVYQTNDLQQAQNTGWNGLAENSNQLVPSGSYPYVLRGVYDTGRAVEKTGSITLFH